jgi:hypothetical protein
MWADLRCVMGACMYMGYRRASAWALHGVFGGFFGSVATVFGCSSPFRQVMHMQ